MSSQALSLRAPCEMMAGSGMPLLHERFLISDERYFELDNDGRHGANDHFSIELFQRGIERSIVALDELSRLG